MTTVLGRTNIYGSLLMSWSTETIRSHSCEGGGIPPYRLFVIADNGDVVCWDADGSVSTAIPAERVRLTRIKELT